MPKRSNFFCIALEGATCDGRTLDRNALVEMAATYNPATYTARVNMEHIRGFSPDAPFNSYGDVVALETREVEIELGGKKEKKLGLFATVDALDNLLAIQAKGQKLFSSIELNPNFAATGKAYLQGLAVTDSPASLGTEIMTFAAGAGDANPFKTRKIDPGNFFSAAHPIESLAFVEAPAPTEAASLFAEVRSFFANFKAAPENKEPEPVVTPPAPAEAAALVTMFATGMEKMTAAMTASITELTGKIDKVSADHTALKAAVEATPNGAPARPVSGGKNANFAVTDC